MRPEHLTTCASLFVASVCVAVSMADERGEVVRYRQPLVTHIYTADPSAHVFDGRLYIYPSHDLDNDTPPSREGDQYDMEDYHVLSWEGPGTAVTDHGQALHLKDIPWASKQLWAPDAAECNGRYLLYFPAKDREGIFRIGVATSSSPTGPFQAQTEPLAGAFSIDPCVFVDDDGTGYLFFGGLWGGQLERWRTGGYVADGKVPAAGEPALGPRVVRLSADFTTTIDGSTTEVSIVDEQGQPVLAGDHSRRFFEAAWVHKHAGTYYLSYSTGDTHLLVYATGEAPTGPYTYQGPILSPVVGWTTHHSIVKFGDQWYLFYHDSSLSGGVSHKRSVKVMPLVYDDEGKIIASRP
ncbi:MAG: glycoside hydrolase family 43 protein [Pirellulaceae bacterium]|nr:glycoside hydrolase family 43 protein [Planctomycetales bacterium]